MVAELKWRSTASQLKVNSVIKMAGYKVIPPDLEDCKSYDTYKKRLIVWEATTPAPDEKKGAIIAGTLPNNSARWPKDLQDKFFEQVDGEEQTMIIWESLQHYFRTNWSLRGNSRTNCSNMMVYHYSLLARSQHCMWARQIYYYTASICLIRLKILVKIHYYRKSF